MKYNFVKELNIKTIKVSSQIQIYCVFEVFLLCIPWRGYPESLSLIPWKLKAGQGILSKYSVVALEDRCGEGFVIRVNISFPSFLHILLHFLSSWRLPTPLPSFYSLCFFHTQKVYENVIFCVLYNFAFKSEMIYSVLTEKCLLAVAVFLLMLVSGQLLILRWGTPR